MDKVNSSQERLENIIRFSQNFKDYTSDVKVRNKLIPKISNSLGLGYKTCEIQISKLRNNKPFEIAFKTQTSYERLCKILDLIDEEFLSTNISYLYLAEPEFEIYREKRYKN